MQHDCGLVISGGGDGDRDVLRNRGDAIATAICIVLETT
jgi:hypothetical protein